MQELSTIRVYQLTYSGNMPDWVYYVFNQCVMSRIPLTSWVLSPVGLLRGTDGSISAEITLLKSDPFSQRFTPRSRLLPSLLLAFVLLRSKRIK